MEVDMLERGGGDVTNVEVEEKVVGDDSKRQDCNRSNHKG
jgi:hypothetical protein